MSEERQAPMKNKKKKYLTGEKVQAEFDCFVKRTINFTLRRIVRDYVREKEHRYTVSIEDLEEMAAPECIPDIEKFAVPLGSSVLLFCDERVANSFGRLKKRHKEVLEKAFVMEMPIKAIAELMELEEKSIQNYISDAKRILRKYLEENEDE